MISDFIIGLNFNRKTNVSPGYLMKLVMQKLIPADQYTILTVIEEYIGLANTTSTKMK